MLLPTLGMTYEGLLAQLSRKRGLFSRSLQSKGVSKGRNKSNKIFHAVKSLSVVGFSGYVITTIKNLEVLTLFSGLSFSLMGNFFLNYYY